LPVLLTSTRIQQTCPSAAPGIPGGCVGDAPIERGELPHAGSTRRGVPLRSPGRHLDGGTLGPPSASRGGPRASTSDTVSSRLSPLFQLSPERKWPSTSCRCSA